MEKQDKGFSLKRLFFGSISKKLLLGFSLIITLMATMAILTYGLNAQISKDAMALKDVEAPLDVMVEQVIGYDAILSENAHISLLHALKNETAEMLEHKLIYDETGAKLDTLLKVDARALLEKSNRPVELKKKVDGYLTRLDEINLKLVELEIGAFEKMEQGDPEEAYPLIVGKEYHQYKKELAQVYKDWTDVEAKVTALYRAKVLENARMVELVNVFFAILSVVAGLIIAFLAARSISKPVIQLRDMAMRLEKGDFNARADIRTSDELRGLGDAFNKATEALGRVDEERKQVDKVKTEFLSITSHELRSPMTPMRAQLQMLQEGYFGKLSAKQKESVDIILRNTTRLDSIIQDFLEISRIEAARLKFNFIRTSLKPHIERLIEEMGGFMAEKKIAIDAQLGELPEMEVDPDRAMQVLRNLMTNAIKFTPEGGRVTVTAKQGKDQNGKGHILLSVSDTGIGIAKENQSRIFEPFFQEEQTMYRKYGGTGLGLALSKGIVDSQGGRIWFESESGKGATFFFTVPLVPVREMAPIRVLFSPKEDIEKKLAKLFVEVLGPLGSKEFERLKGDGGIVKDALIDYADWLVEKKIITGQAAESFKGNVMGTFGKAPDKIQLKKDKP